MTSDTLGSSFARVRAGDGAPTLALVGHIDEIGIAVTNIEENGLLSFTTIGGIAPEMLHGQRIELLTRDGASPGRRAKADRAGADARPAAAGATDLHIDIGAKSRERRRASSGSATSASGTAIRVELPNGRLLSTCARQPPRRLHRARVRAPDRRDEGGAGRRRRGGSRAGGDRSLRRTCRGVRRSTPQVAIAIDVTPATDYPGGDARRAGPIELGMGAMIARGPTLNKQVVDLLAEAAETDGIPHAFEIYAPYDVDRRRRDPPRARRHPDRAALDPDAPTCTARTSCATSQDVESIIRLIVAFAKRLSRDQSFVR